MEHIKDISFNELPKGWQVKNLGEITTINYGKSPKKILSTDGIIPVIGTGGIERFGDDYLYDGESIVLGRKGTIDNPIFIKGKFWAIDTTYYLTKFNEVNVKWLFYYLSSINFRVMNEATGVPSLSRGLLYAIKVKTPPQEEQTQIATILSQIDQAIEQTEQIIAKYQRIKTGLMQDLLTRGIDEQGTIRLEKMHEFKDSPLGRIPKEWKVGEVGKSCEIHNHLRKPISAQEREHIKGIYPYYGPTGILDYINEFRIDGEYVLIGEDGDHFLKFAKQPMTIRVSGKFNVNNHAHILKGTDKCLTAWIHCFFCHRDITLHLTRQGAGRLKLNKASLQQLKIVLPGLAEQNSIIRVLDAYEKGLTSEKKQLYKLQKIKTGIMQDLLTGKKRLNLDLRV